ncbi:DUF218 domain-containing protein [Pelagophyceae sp. CCMP2097]|nr:DUF218 domain-containing protein [Pelagophyceae sp. CCMP2097]
MASTFRAGKTSRAYLCAVATVAAVAVWCFAFRGPREGLSAIVVPGGGQAATFGAAVPGHMRLRLDAAARLYLASAAPRPRLLLLSAGTPHKPNPRDAEGFDSKEATTNARYLMAQHNIPPSDILEEALSLDTIGNAFFLRLLHTDVGGYNRLLIVNNEFHLPRTWRIFDHVFSLSLTDASGKRPD